ncbi:AMP-binding protein [Tenacibaculum aiptasiae]|uniref:AMP-binding protein n=1 Tax=Tenacibaculum aiptasiae TaxID=426481 RepID=A0A7J5AQ90_9FLAO|nr:AMP-binding protein [Tenacibaculum aiptasiae]KAB1159776.1 AMP-binding protein [Tenacibaculum aiptasiae]
MKNTSFHKSFKLNSKSFSDKDELLDFSKEISDSIFSFFNDWFSTNDFVVVNTSGSTGTPKPIKLKKEFMKNSAVATGTFFTLREGTTALLCLSTDYIAGKMMLVRALTLGWEIDIVAPVSNPLEGLKKKYDFSAMVPMQLRNSLNELYKIDKLIVGGGVVSNDLIEEIQEKETKIYATYGMTETITHVAIKKLNHVALSDYNTYEALPNVNFSKDSRNCLVIEAPKVTVEKLITNDVVSLISDKEFDWLGRFDNVINSGGIKLHPEKIEEKLSKIISERFFVIGVPDTVLGEKLILIVEGKKKNILLNSLQDLSKYEVPKEVYFLDKFIETETKKIQRKKTLGLIYRS